MTLNIVKPGMIAPRYIKVFKLEFLYIYHCYVNLRSLEWFWVYTWKWPLSLKGSNI